MNIYQMGANTGRSPFWQAALAYAVIREIDERGLGVTPRSLHNQRALNLMVSNLPPLEHLDHAVRLALQQDQIRLYAIQAITHTDADDFLALRHIQQTHLHRSIERLHHRVATIQNPQTAARIWSFQVYLECTSMAWAGLRWFTPRYFSRMRSLGEAFLATSTLIGVWIGFLIWGFSNMGKPGEYSDWINTISLVITISTSIGLVATFAVQIYSMITTLAGPVQQWSRKQILIIVLEIGFLISISTLLYSGYFNHLIFQTMGIMTSISSGFHHHVIATVAFPTLVTVYALYRCIRILRSEYIRYSDRIIEALTAFIFAVLFSIPTLQLLEMQFLPSGTLSFPAGGAVLILIAVRITLSMLRLPA